MTIEELVECYNRMNFAKRFSEEALKTEDAGVLIVALELLNDAIKYHDEIFGCKENDCPDSDKDLQK